MPSELVYQHQQQTPINGTISGMAPPGSDTGYYYIPVANLPWQTSWRELKDHVRTVCSVEHVEINEDSTSGHVVLKGRSNFDAAFRLLNGGIFHDRALIADGRNADSWVLVKQHVDGPTSSQSSGAPRHTISPAQLTPQLMAQPSPGYGEWTATPTGEPYMMNAAMDYPPYFVPYTAPGHTDPATPYGMAGHALEHPRATENSAASYLSGAGCDTRRYNSTGSYGDSHASSHSDMTSREGDTYRTGAVPTKRRRIIIQQLPAWVSESQIRELIRHKAGSASEKLRKLDMPLADGQPGVNCGYTIATFESADAAEKVIRRLNNYHYEGRVLGVRYTKDDGADHQPSQGFHPGHQYQSHQQSRRDRHDEKDKKGKGKDNSHTSAGSNENKSKSTSFKSDIVIAHGSSFSCI